MPSFKYLYLKSDSPFFVHGKGMEAKFIMAQNPSGVIDWNVFHLTIDIRPSVKPTTNGPDTAGLNHLNPSQTLGRLGANPRPSNTVEIFEKHCHSYQGKPPPTALVKRCVLVDYVSFVSFIME